MNTILENAIEHWKYVALLVAPPKNEVEFEQLIFHLDALLDRIGDDDYHPLIRLVDIMSDAVSAYEAEHFQEPIGKGIDALRYLMESSARATYPKLAVRV